MAYIVMADIVMAYISMTYIVMAYPTMDQLLLPPVNVFVIIASLHR